MEGAFPLNRGMSRSDRGLKGRSPSPAEKEESQSETTGFLSSSGGRTRTSGLRVMSPTSYQLLYPAMFGTAKVGNFFEIPNFFKKSPTKAGDLEIYLMSKSTSIRT